MRDSRSKDNYLLWPLDRPSSVKAEALERKDKAEASLLAQTSPVNKF